MTASRRARSEVSRSSTGRRYQDANVCSIIGVVRVDYREEPCRTALNRVTGMPFRWSLNPYTGCAHRCTFCYVRAFEARADRDPGEALRPLDPRQGQRRRGPAARAGAALMGARGGDRRRGHRPVPAGRGSLPPHARLPRRARRGADAVLDHHARPARRARPRRAAGRPRGASTSACTSRCRRSTSASGARPSRAPRRPARRLDVVRRLAEAGIDVGVAVAPVLPGLSDRPEQLAAVVRAARLAGARSIWAAARSTCGPGRASTSSRRSGARLAGGARTLRAPVRRACLPPGGRHATGARDRCAASRGETTPRRGGRCSGRRLSRRS